MLNFNSQTRFCELGAGDARLSLSALPFCEYVCSVELNSMLFKKLLKKRKQLDFPETWDIREECILSTNLDGFNSFYTFLSDDMNEMLRPRLEEKKGITVVSLDFEFKGWEILQRRSLMDMELYLYHR